MKINRFLLAISLSFATMLTLSCSSDNSEDSNQYLSSDSSGESSPSNRSSGSSNEATGGYLGYGYDVINSSYINRSDVKISHPILDQKKMSKDAMIVAEKIAGKQDFQMFAGSDLKAFYTDRNSGFGLSLGYSNVLFSGKFGVEFSGTTSENRVDSNSYVRGRSYRYTQDDYIKGATPQKLTDYLTQDFINALQTRTASQILDQYGTHVLVRYYKGGSLEFNYTYNGKGLSKNDNKQLKSALQASYKDITGGVSGGTASTTESEELEKNSLFHYYSYGGKPIDAFSLEDLKRNYGDWLNSIEDKADICGIEDFNQSLIPLWELATATGNSNLAKELENEFNVRAFKAGKALLVKKIKIEKKEFDLESNNANPTYTFDKASKDSPAQVEIYVLGGGGGGQGGDFNNGLLNKVFGTGGGGGGGEVAFLKMSIEEPINFKITLGKGGAGGRYYESGTGGQNSIGQFGSNGNATKVEWSAGGENFSIVANGGSGGNSLNTVNNEGGKGGTGGYVKPGSASGSVSYKQSAWGTVNGEGGRPGDPRSDSGGEGGKGAKLEKDKIDNNSEEFGGSAGGQRPTAAKYGGGGYGGYKQQDGGEGGKGFAVIKIMYLVLEE
ncbi:MAG: MACPF domain-containing protein [Fibromonadales bacterium]|nr:MACPF domain-containing protein [Fibromonadales bacterium]MCL1957564.1 MACPF domain-containing protein [Fibromonadales bacterium]